MGVECYLLVALIGLSLMANDVMHLFMCLLADCTSSLQKYLFRSFASVLIGLSFY